MSFSVQRLNPIIIPINRWVRSRNDVIRTGVHPPVHLVPESFVSCTSEGLGQGYFVVVRPVSELRESPTLRGKGKRSFACQTLQFQTVFSNPVPWIQYRFIRRKIKVSLRSVLRLVLTTEQDKGNHCDGITVTKDVLRDGRRTYLHLPNTDANP